MSGRLEVGSGAGSKPCCVAIRSNRRSGGEPTSTGLPLEPGTKKGRTLRRGPSLGRKRLRRRTANAALQWLSSRQSEIKRLFADPGQNSPRRDFSPIFNQICSVLLIDSAPFGAWCGAKASDHPGTLPSRCPSLRERRARPPASGARRPDRPRRQPGRHSTRSASGHTRRPPAGWSARSSPRRE